MSADASAFLNDPLLTQPLMLSGPQIRNASDPQRDAILLTGGTGFVGTYCIGEIMRQNPGVHVFAVVRGGKKWRLASQEFPRSVAGSELGEEPAEEFNPVYGHELPKGWAARCTALDGDCSAGDLENGIALFNLCAEDLETIRRRCFACIHLACSTSYVNLYTENRKWAVAFNTLCGFCTDNNIAVHYLGGTGRGVYENVTDPSEINEESLFSNGYFRLKHVQHQIIKRYINAGMRGTAYDVPYIFGAPETGGQYPGLHYEPIRILAIFAATGMRLEMPWDTVTVDVLCNLMVKKALEDGGASAITCSNGRQSYYRVFDEAWVTEAMMGEELKRRGFKTELYSKDEFIARALAKGMPKKILDRYFPDTCISDAEKIADNARPQIIPTGLETMPSAECLTMSLDNVEKEWLGCVARYQRKMSRSKL